MRIHLIAWWCWNSSRPPAATFSRQRPRRALGTPNLSPKASLTVRNGVLYFADIASPRTILNLKRNSAVEINVVDIFQRRGYRFKGRALILTPGEDEHLMIADWVRATNGQEYPVDHVVKIETTSITPLL